MNVQNNKSGFTLLEIIIVIIIVGVLASLALPQFFATIEFSRSTEALNNLGVIRKSIERCGLLANDVSGCDSFADIDIDNPGLEAGSHFTYGINVDDGETYQVTATRNTFNGGTSTDTVVLSVTSATITRTGSGHFASIK